MKNLGSIYGRVFTSKNQKPKTKLLGFDKEVVTFHVEEQRGQQTRFHLLCDICVWLWFYLKISNTNCTFAHASHCLSTAGYSPTHLRPKFAPGPHRLSVTDISQALSGNWGNRKFQTSWRKCIPDYSRLLPLLFTQFMVLVRIMANTVLRVCSHSVLEKSRIRVSL